MTVRTKPNPRSSALMEKTQIPPLTTFFESDSGYPNELWFSACLNMDFGINWMALCQNVTQGNGVGWEAVVNLIIRI